MLTKKTFQLFIQEINAAQQQFFVWFYSTNEFVEKESRWNGMENIITYRGYKTDEPCSERVNKYINFWPIVLPTLQQGWILATRRLFDPIYFGNDKKKEKPRLCLNLILEQINNPAFTQQVNHEKLNHDRLLASLKQIRDDSIAHNDLTSKSSQHRAQIKAGMEDLFEWLINVVDRIKQNNPHLQKCSNVNPFRIEELSRAGVEEIFKKLTQ